MEGALDLFFQPRSVAVIGASRTPGKVGHDILSNLVRHGFPYPIYPINPNAEMSLLGLPTYPSVSSVPGPIDLAILVIPSGATLASLDDCARKGVKALVIISAGFREAGPEGAAMEKKLAHKARILGLRVIGPNCLGVIDTASRLNASFAADMPEQGNISFISQSGALCTALMDWAISEGVGFSKIVSLGNKCDVDETDILTLLGEDDNTEVILGYIEALSDGTRFMRTAKQISKRKPIIIAKSGRTALGARAASSHTGSLAGSNMAYETAFWRSGIIRANTMEELIDYALAFSYQPVPKRPGLLIVTNAGGPGILAADAAGEYGVKLADLPAEAKSSLKEHLPPTASLANPVDILGDAKADRYALVLEKAMSDPGVGGVLALLTPQSTTQVEETAKAISAASLMAKKPVLTSFMGKESVTSGLRLLQKNKIPNYPYPERAVFAFDRMVQYRAWQTSPFAPPEPLEVDSERVSSLIAMALAEGRSSLRQEEVFEVFSAYGLRVPRTLLAQDEEHALELAMSLGLPVAMKVSSPQIVHKSDVGGVRVGIRDEDAVRRAFNEIMENCSAAVPDASIEGVIVQEMIEKGRELIVGGHRDPLFGPMIMFGLGGIYVETIQDVSFRIAPLALEDTTVMLREIRSFPLLAGTRGEEPSDIEAVQNAILRVSRLMENHEEILEMDVNPLKAMAYGKGAMAVDGRISLQVAY